jgi:nicotinamidase-related amidase
MQELSLKALRLFAGVGPVALWSPTTALLIVDMQVSCIRPNGYTIRRLLEGNLPEAARQYQAQLDIAIPNLAQLLAHVRQSDMPVFHTHVISVPGRKPGGRPYNRRIVRADSEEARIISELSPIAGETTLPKSTPGVFVSTNLDYLLRCRGVESLIVGGVVTNGCVEHAIRHAHDLGYACVLISDGTAALTDEIQENTLQRLDHRRAHVRSTAELLELDSIPATETQ